MFEVGKKYQNKGNNSIFICLSVHLYRDGLQAGVLQFVPNDARIIANRNGDKGDIPYVYPWSDKWVEVVEPKVLISERYVYLLDGLLFNFNSPYLTNNNKYKELGKISITYTEGQGLTVEVIG